MIESPLPYVSHKTAPFRGTTSSLDVSYLLETQHPHQTSLIKWKDNILIRRTLLTEKTTSSSDVPYLLERQHPY